MALLPWHTSVSILVAGGLVAGAVYLALRPSASREQPESTATERAAARPTDPFAISPMAERDRRRGWDDEPDESTPTPAPGTRGEKPIGEAELAMAVAPPLSGAPSTPRELVERVQRDAAEAFEGIRTRVRSDCWDALPDDPEAPEQVSVLLSLSYGADGKVIASGISENREQHRDGLAACLGPLVHGLEVPAPGTNLSIEVNVTIP